jgi:hypothetical protein
VADVSAALRGQAMRFSQQAAAGLHFYLVVFDLSNSKVFDWNTNTWVASLSVATTPQVVMTEVPIGVKSTYAVDVDLTVLFTSDTSQHDLQVVVYQRLTSTPAPLTDTAQAQMWKVSLCCGHVVTGDSTAIPFLVSVTADYTVSNGTSMHLTAELQFNGNTVPIHALDTGATCAFVLDQDATTTGGARTTPFSIATGTVGAANASSRFEAEQTSPGLAANRGFTVTATIVTGGITYVGSCKGMTV